MIRLVAATRRTGTRTVLDEVTLHARAGELVLVEAGRGAGKTTLLRIAAGLCRPDAGEVWLAERDISRLQRASLPYVRRNVGYLPPDAALIARETAIENVMLALAARGGHTVGKARLAAWEMLKRVGVEACADWDAERLSAGERRLVGLARALAGSPPIVILDDPAAGLAPADVGTVLSAMLGAAEGGAAVLAASSDAAFVSAAVRAGGRRVRLEDGRVVGSAGLVAVGAVARSVPIAASEPLDVTVDESRGKTSP